MDTMFAYRTFHTLVTTSVSFSELTASIVDMKYVEDQSVHVWGVKGGSLLKLPTAGDDSLPVQRLHSVLQDEGCKRTLAEELSKPSQMEREIAEVLACRLIQPLTGRCFLPAKEHRKPEENDNVGLMGMGMGANSTWHGFSDILASPICADDENDDDDGHSQDTTLSVGKEPDESSTDSETESEGEKSMVECTREDNYSRDIFQVIGQTTVFSFTQHNRHKDMNPMLPGLGINPKTFFFVLYDCQKDVLLTSPPVTWLRDGRIVDYAIVLMWALLHHRRFLAVLSPSISNFESRFHYHSSQQNTLDIYKQMDSYNHLTFERKHFIDPLRLMYVVDEATTEDPPQRKKPKRRSMRQVTN